MAQKGSSAGCRLRSWGEPHRVRTGEPHILVTALKPSVAAPEALGVVVRIIVFGQVGRHHVGRHQHGRIGDLIAILFETASQ